MSKFRKGFVTNSSSSSFICEVSGEHAEGYDLSLEEAEMYECENGHIFCTCYLVGDLDNMDKGQMLEYLKNKKKTWEESGSSYYQGKVKTITKEILYLESLTDEDEILENIEELVEAYELNSHYEVPASNCPICTMQEIRDKDALKYLMQKTGMTKQEVHDEMRKTGFKIQ